MFVEVSFQCLAASPSDPQSSSTTIQAENRVTSSSVGRSSVVQRSTAFAHPTADSIKSSVSRSSDKTSTHLANTARDSTTAKASQNIRSSVFTIATSMVPMFYSNSVKINQSSIATSTNTAASTRYGTKSTVASQANSINLTSNSVPAQLSNLTPTWIQTASLKPANVTTSNQINDTSNLTTSGTKDSTTTAPVKVTIPYPANGLVSPGEILADPCFNGTACVNT